MKTGSRSESIAAWFRPRSEEPAPRRAALLLQPERFSSAQAIVGAYYAVLLFLAVGELYSWSGYLEATTLQPRWPVFWLRWVDTRLGISLILWFHLIASLLAVALARYRAARIAVFVAWLMFLSLRFSFGSINHGDHLGLLIGFVLIFLPAGWHAYPTAGRSVRSAMLLVFSGCQAMIMLIYSMSGLWKLVGIPRQLVRGQIHYLHPEGLAHQIADKLLTSDTTSQLGPWLIEHSWLGVPLIVVAIYLELFALWVVLRPSLHQAWGLSLILFHASTHLAMGIGFVHNSLWLALFFVLSPLRPRELRWRQMLRDLPVFGGLARRSLRPMRATLVLAVLGFAASASAQAPPASLLIPDRVFDGEVVHEGWVVVVREDRIAAVGPSERMLPQPDAVEIRLPGARPAKPSRRSPSKSCGRS